MKFAIFALLLLSSCTKEDMPVGIDRGKYAAAKYGCVACHSSNGSQMMGPTWKGLYGSVRILSDGTEVVADKRYIYESISQPNAKVVEGFPASVMPSYSMDNRDLKSLVLYLESLR